jgi:hypothetical protein
MYKFQVQNGITHRDYNQPFPSWGFLDVQIESELTNLYLGWFDCNSVLVTEFSLTQSGNVHYRNIELANLDVHFDKIIFAKIYQYQRSGIFENVIVGLDLAISEPFVVSEFYENIQEVQYSNNEPYDSMNFNVGSFVSRAYFRMTYNQPKYIENQKTYLKSNGQTVKLSSRLERKKQYLSEYQPDYRIELLSKINSLDSIQINGDSVGHNESEITNPDKYSLSQIGATYTEQLYNFVNSNCL